MGPGGLEPPPVGLKGPDAAANTLIPRPLVRRKRCKEVRGKQWVFAIDSATQSSPAWIAWIVQVPTATSVTVVPDTVHTAVVVEAKLTANPDDAVAVTVNGAVPRASFASVPNVID